jgi:hypothetical protein
MENQCNMDNFFEVIYSSAELHLISQAELGVLASDLNL